MLFTKSSSLLYSAVVAFFTAFLVALFFAEFLAATFLTPTFFVAFLAAVFFTFGVSETSSSCCDLVAVFFLALADCLAF